MHLNKNPSLTLSPVHPSHLQRISASFMMITVLFKEKAKSAGLWNLFLPKEADPDQR